MTLSSMEALVSRTPDDSAYGALASICNVNTLTYHMTIQSSAIHTPGLNLLLMQAFCSWLYNSVYALDFIEDEFLRSIFLNDDSLRHSPASPSCQFLRDGRLCYDLASSGYQRAQKSFLLPVCKLPQGQEDLYAP